MNYQRNNLPIDLSTKVKKIIYQQNLLTDFSTKVKK